MQEFFLGLVENVGGGTGGVSTPEVVELADCNAVSGSGPGPVGGRLELCPADMDHEVGDPGEFPGLPGVGDREDGEG